MLNPQSQNLWRLGLLLLSILMSCQNEHPDLMGAASSSTKVVIQLHRERSNCRLQVLAYGGNLDALKNLDLNDETSFLLDLSDAERASLSSVTVGAVCLDAQSRIVEMGSTVLSVPANTQRADLSLKRLFCEGSWCIVPAKFGFPGWGRREMNDVYAQKFDRAWIVGSGGLIARWNGVTWRPIEGTIAPGDPCSNIASVGGSSIISDSMRISVSATDTSACKYSIYRITNGSLIPASENPSYATPKDKPYRIRLAHQQAMSTNMILISPLGMYTASLGGSYTSIYNKGSRNKWIDALFRPNAAQTQASPYFTLFENTDLMTLPLGKYFIAAKDKESDAISNPAPTEYQLETHLVPIPLQTPRRIGMHDEDRSVDTKIWVSGVAEPGASPVKLLVAKGSKQIVNINNAAFNGDATIFTNGFLDCDSIYVPSDTVGYVSCYNAKQETSLVLRCQVSGSGASISVNCGLSLPQDTARLQMAELKDRIVAIHGTKSVDSGQIQLWAIGKSTIWLYQGDL